MAKAAGVSRTAVFKHIHALRGMGYQIEASRARGYLLVPRPDGLLPLEIRMRTKSTLFTHDVVTIDSLASTQDWLRIKAQSGAAEGAVVVALEQSSGRGRMGRGWSSPHGGLWFSLLLRPSLPLKGLPKLTLLFGVVMAEALGNIGVKAYLKWPNDVLLEGRKVCGVLMEASVEPDRVEYVLVGIGINANFMISSLPRETQYNSTTLLESLGRPVDRCGLLAQILERAEYWYRYVQREGFSLVIEAWKSRSSTIGQTVTVSSFGSELKGTAVDIDSDGSLVLETDQGRANVYSGDVLLESPR